MTRGRLPFGLTKAQFAKLPNTMPPPKPAIPPDIEPEDVTPTPRVLALSGLKFRPQFKTMPAKQGVKP